MMCRVPGHHSFFFMPIRGFGTISTPPMSTSDGFSFVILAANWTFSRCDSQCLSNDSPTYRRFAYVFMPPLNIFNSCYERWRYAKYIRLQITFFLLHICDHHDFRSIVTNLLSGGVLSWRNLEVFLKQNKNEKGIYMSIDVKTCQVCKSVLNPITSLPVSIFRWTAAKWDFISGSTAMICLYSLSSSLRLIPSRFASAH